MRAVELHALFVGLRVEPVEEDARAGAHARRAARERRPRDAAARREVQAADMRLELLPDAAADGEILPHPAVVLQIDATLRLRNRDVGMAEVAGVGGGTPGRKGAGAGDRNRPAGVAESLTAIRAGVELETGPNRLAAGRDVEIVGSFDQRQPARAGELRAAGVERVEDQDRRRLAERRGRHLLGPPLDAQLVVERPADGAGA